MAGVLGVWKNQGPLRAASSRQTEVPSSRANRGRQASAQGRAGELRWPGRSRIPAVASGIDATHGHGPRIAPKGAKSLWAPA